MEGMEYIRVRPLLMGLTLLGLVGTLFALPYNSILPVFADSILDAGAAGLGLLGAGAGVGGLLGAFTVAFFSGYRQLKYLLIVGGITLGLMILLFSLSTVFLISLGLVTIVGFSMTLFLTSNMALLQLASPDYIRGRVIGIRLIIMGMGPIGMILLGVGAEWVSPAYSLALFGALTAGLILMAVAGIPALRQAENFVHQESPQAPQMAPVEVLEGDDD
jgi:MFS family permease